MAEISISELDQAEAGLVDAKKAAKKRNASDSAVAAYQDAAANLVSLRRAYRQQEAAAGRRVGLVATTEG